MAFDHTTRNRLARFAGDCRGLLTEEFTRQLQSVYGMDPKTGDAAEIDSLTLTSEEFETARLLRDTMEHYLASADTSTAAKAKKSRIDVLGRIVREQAFTVLNRLCALRMSEARGLLIESIGKGYQSKGFQLYKQLAGPALGETGDAYRCFIFCVFDEFGIDLPVLFDRFSPEGRLFPREAALLEVLAQINDADIDPLWAEDETIGWIYQYFNSKEERQEMRDAVKSGAPRNSRELAVRNQFFTPRYVVEFLTDNTLGRIWYEMTQGETELKDSCRYLVRRPNETFLAEGEEATEQGEPSEDLSQEELLQQPVHIPFRPLKDPRDITMLDPACGSMHFGLYAFDLFERIYAEAWDVEAERGADAFVRPEGLKPLRETYDSKEAYLRDVPRLIIERNIHGIDIDPRAVQIAGLSLWLRAQKNWASLQLGAADRPQIERSNIICAEPMPGEADMLEEFLKGLHDDRLESLIRRVLNVPDNQQVRATARMAEALCDLVRTVWKEMELAGEAGILLQIEETLADAIAAGKKEWVEKAPLFRVMEFGLTADARSNPTVKYYTTVPGEEEEFWNHAEAMVLIALDDYAERSQAADAARKRMFARDAAHGFAFVDSCRHRFSVVLMNPPFGDASDNIAACVSKRFPAWNKNILCAFIECGIGYLDRGGLLGSVFDKTAAIKSTYERFRREVVLDHRRLQTQASLGWGVLDGANVEVAALVASSDAWPSPKAFFDVSAVQLGGKGNTLATAIGEVADGTENACSYYSLPADFGSLPNAVFAFDFPLWLQRLFVAAPSLESFGGGAFVGHSFKSERHFRVVWELPSEEDIVFNATRWAWLFNGGDYCPFYNPERDVVAYGNDGDAVAEDESVIFRSLPLHGQGGIGYGKRGDFIDTQLLSHGHVFTVEGEGAVVASIQDRLYYSAFLTSHVFSYGINLYCGQHKYPGYVNLFPCPVPTPEMKQRIVGNARQIWALKRRWYSGDESEANFLLPHLLWLNESSLRARAKMLVMSAGEAAQTIQKAMADIDSAFETVFGLGSDAREQLKATAQRRPPDCVWLKLPDEPTAAYFRLSADLFGYFVGCGFGRWDLRKQEPPSDVAPEQAMAAAPPRYAPASMLDESGRPLLVQPENYPLDVAISGICADDVSSGSGLIASVNACCCFVFGNDADQCEHDLCAMLGASSLSEYLRSQFFADHLHRYSESRRTAPVYWPLSTPSCSYTLWLYYHRLADQTLYTCVNDFIDPKLKQVLDEAGRLRGKNSRSSGEEKELERLSDLELELKDFRNELLRIAKFWKPNLNDGVQITAAPLWKLFQHKAWQKRLKETWEKLEDGEYDWAHLALSIWPDRVVRASHKDRSYAIAHDLEDQLWQEVEVEKKTKGGKVKKVKEWRPRDLSESQLDAIVTEVKAR